MNSNENSKEIQKKLSNKKWLKECLLIKIETGVPDLLILLANASGKENKEFILFVMINVSSGIIEEKKIKLLNTFFNVRKKDFDYS